MGRDEVDGAKGRAFAHHVLLTGDSACHLLHSVVVIAGAAIGRHVLKPKLSYGVSKPVVPLWETRWEVSGLPAAHANIPGFDDELR